MKLSIIIPAYNVGRFIARCVDSCENQDIDKDDFEIIIINDGSNDTTGEVASSLSGKYGNIIVKTQKNQGQAVARNLGLDISRGEYVMFVDADDYLATHKIGGFLDRMVSSDIDVLEYRFKVEGPDGQFYDERIKELAFDTIYTGEEAALQAMVFASVCGKICRADIFNKNDLRFLAGIKHEDSEMCFRLYPLIQRYLIVNEFAYYYRYNPVSTDRNVDIESAKRGLRSDAIIAGRLLKMAECETYSQALRNRYRKIANSMMASYFINARKNRIWTRNDFKSQLAELIDMGCYPIKGRSNSRKSDLLISLLNRPAFLKYFVCRNK